MSQKADLPTIRRMKKIVKELACSCSSDSCCGNGDSVAFVLVVLNGVVVKFRIKSVMFLLVDDLKNRKT